MVVDDDPLVRGLLHAVLQDGRYELVEACDGMEALTLLQDEPPDVVILDVMMPGVSGYEVCRQMREDRRMHGATIVILTARDTQKDRAEAARAGADAYFTKPFSPLELLEAIMDAPVQRNRSLVR